MSSSDNEPSYLFSLSPSTKSDNDLTQSSYQSAHLTESPPSYSVRENTNGQFFNYTHNLAWPKRPEDGYYSLKQYFMRREEKAKYLQDQMNEAFLQSRSTAASVLRDDFLSDSYDKVKWFLGTCSPLTAAEKTLKGAMNVFYPLAEPELTDIPLVVSPVLIYKNHDGIVYLFPITYDIDTRLWSLHAPSYHSPSFGRLKFLIDHLRTIGFVDEDTGRVESFPYWLINDAIGTETI